MFTGKVCDAVDQQLYARNWLTGFPGDSGHRALPG